jgi:hypothetical protein
MARSPTDTIRFLTLEELARLFAVVRASPRNRALFLTALFPNYFRNQPRASEKARRNSVLLVDKQGGCYACTMGSRAR